MIKSIIADLVVVVEYIILAFVVDNPLALKTFVVCLSLLLLAYAGSNAVFIRMLREALRIPRKDSP